MTPASAITFPFERAKEYPLAALKAFQSKLLKARQGNCTLSNELRAPVTGSPRWIKLRNEELVPLLYYTRHRRISDAGTFVIMPEGSKSDVRLTSLGATEYLQITVADPKWNFPEPGGIRHPGHFRRASMDLLNLHGSSGWGQISKSGDKLTQNRRMVSTPELEEAHHNGLADALANKLVKSYEQGECVLLIYARAFGEGLSPDRFQKIARNVLDDAMSKVVNQAIFKHIVIVDGLDHSLIEYS
jgi:hypothetical protein